MDNPLPQAMSPSELAPVNGHGVTAFSQQTVVLTKQADIELKWQAHYWRALHERLVEREVALKAEVEALQAIIRDLNQRLYGAKSEQSASPDSAAESKLASPRKRGQQPGSTGHGRSDRGALPVVTEVHDVSETAKHCPACGAAFVPFPGSEESNLIEVQVQAHIPCIQRQRYHKTCQCPDPRDCDSVASAAADPEKPLGRVGLDDGLAGQIPLWPSHPPLL